MLAKHLRRTSEFQQLYISTTLFFFALALIVVFVPIYLYQLGYGLPVIAGYYLVGKVAHLITTLPATKLSNTLGVKHAMSISYGLFFIQAIVLLFITEVSWLIPVAAAIQGIAGCNFSITRFSCMSRLGRQGRLGHDLALVSRWQKVATAAGVLSGGLISQIFNVPLTLTVVAGLIVLSIIPLMLSPEPIKNNQNLNLRQLPWKRLKRDFISALGAMFCGSTTQEAWVIFLAIFVFVGTPYAGVGFITSLAITVSVLISYYFGQLIDHGHGRRLLRNMVPLFSISHLMRVFIGSPALAYGFNVVAQIPESGINLSHGQGTMNRGQEISHFQLLYFAVLQITYGIASLTLWLVVLLIALQGHDKLSLQVVFIMAAFLSFLILSERFTSRPPSPKKSA